MANENFLSAQEIRRLLDTGALSARDYVASLLSSIAQAEPRLHAFIEVYVEEAMSSAARYDNDRGKGSLTAPLAGPPFAVKDLVDVQGRPTTAQSKAFTGAIARDDAAIVSRLRSAGAILIGKLSLEEYGIGSPMDELPWPPARNPWDPARNPGGSSSGCGVALAAGLVPIAIGTDTGDRCGTRQRYAGWLV